MAAPLLMVVSSTNLNQEASQTVLTPKQAADRLHVSASGLRRLASIYAAVHGDLPREPDTQNRLWPEEAVEQLEQARALVQAERFKSIKEALEAIARGVDVADVTVSTPPARVELGPDLLRELVNEMRRLGDAVEALQAENAELREQLKALAPPADTPSGGKAEYVAEMEKIHADYEKRIRYLQGELERRDSALISAIDDKHKRVPWWRRMFGRS
jgi:hypothetical protein